MKRLNVLFALIPVLFIVLSFSYKLPDDNTKGKELFTANKCGTCHSVESAGITKKGKGPDLSQIGDTVKADWISKFLKKQVKKDEKNHPLAFKGSDEDLKTLSSWIVSLNSGKKTRKALKKDQSSNETMKSGQSINEKKKSSQSSNDILKPMEKMHSEMAGTKITGNADRDFAHLMIHHHQGAIDLCNYELSNGSDQQVKDLAKKVVDSQEADINKLKQYDTMNKMSSASEDTVNNNLAKTNDSTGAGDKELADITNSGENSDVTGSEQQNSADRDMIESMHDKINDVNLSGETDKDYVTLMIRHHQTAIEMIQNYLSRIQDSQLKDIANKMIDSNQSDIVELQNLHK